MNFRRGEYNINIYFITFNIFNKQTVFESDKIKNLFIQVLVNTRNKYNYNLYGFVILLDHVHLLIKPNERNNISDVVRYIKGQFSREINKIITEAECLSYADEVSNLDSKGLNRVGEACLPAGRHSASQQ